MSPSCELANSQVAFKAGQLEFDFHKAVLPLNHDHYDRFDTVNDEVMDKFSNNFLTNSLGEIDKAVMSLDEAEVTFIRRPDPVMRDPTASRALVGTYETATGVGFRSCSRTLRRALPVRDGGRLGHRVKIINPAGEFINVRK